MRSLLIVLAVCASACTNAPHVESKLRECGLLSEGELGRLMPFYAPDACYRDCLASASCDELQGALCGESISLLQACDARCAHHCPNGALIALDRVCDGIINCDDGEDEQGCASFTCSDGMVVPANGRCNGWWQCAGGEDERDCGPECDAVWGTRVLLSSVACDGYEQCVGGEDEDGCQTFGCSNGEAVLMPFGVSPRCDGVPSCSDGSDEHGCATLTLGCETP